MKKHVKNNIDWVGKIDWELRKFHGDEYSTHRGSSYNSYLIREEKTVLIDTVWMPFAKEFVENLAKEVDLAKIDFIVANHGEIDHSGSLPELLRRIPDVPIYCSANAVKSLKGQYHQDWNFQVVKTGDRVSVGNGKELVFVEMPLLHWPDSMMCYLTGDNVLFSNDAFGQHYASENLFNDLVDQSELWAEAVKYYANILTPFSGILTKKLAEVLSLNLSIDIIAPSHGILWRKDPAQIVAQYGKWADKYQENRVAVLYDTMWDGTRRLAEAITEGIREARPDLTVVVHNCSKSDKNDIMTEIFRAKGVVLGSPTVNRGYLSVIAALLEEARGLQFKGKKAAAFGTYGWSGESPKLLSEGLKDAGFEVEQEALKVLWNPDPVAMQAAREFGASFAKGL
jgi:flavorubredoxin